MAFAFTAAHRTAQSSSPTDTASAATSYHLQKNSNRDKNDTFGAEEIEKVQAASIFGVAADQTFAPQSCQGLASRHLYFFAF